MAKRFALAFLAVSSPLILLAFLFPIPGAELVFAVLSVAFPIALIVLGAEHRGRLGPLRVPLIGLVVFLELCVAGMLVLRGEVAGGPWIGGLPMAAAIQFYGLFLVPLVFVSLAYALTFERFGLRQDDLDELRRRFRRTDSGG